MGDPQMAPEVTLRGVQQSDLQVFFENQGDSAAIRMAQAPGRAHEAFMAHWKKILGTATCVIRTITYQGAVAGYVSSWEDEGECKIGYHLGRNFWGKGIASAALPMFLTEMRARPLMAYVARHNLGSIRVLQKCGFTLVREGRFTGVDGGEYEEFVLTLI
jgi:RimJ/RimL family protein N-acetyltransferase